MDEFNLLDLLAEEVVQAHELIESEPYVEEVNPAYVTKSGELPVGVPLFRNDNWY